MYNAIALTRVASRPSIATQRQITRYSYTAIQLYSATTVSQLRIHYTTSTTPLWGSPGGAPPRPAAGRMAGRRLSQPQLCSTPQESERVTREQSRDRASAPLECRVDRPSETRASRGRPARYRRAAAPSAMTHVCCARKPEESGM